MKSEEDQKESFDVLREADRVVLSRHGPPGVLVNEEFDILQFRGTVAPYITPLPGRASLSLLKMAPEGLAAAMEVAINEARQKNIRVSRSNLSVVVGRESQLIDLDITPINSLRTKERFFLVLFIRSTPSPAADTPHRVAAAEPTLDLDNRLEQLERELESTRMYLQSTIEKHELSNEELRSNAVSSTGKKHGYIFEVPADTSLNAVNTTPLVAMGRFNHEASAIDPATGFWYLTEDQGSANTLYRFRPSNLAGGLNSLHGGGTLQGLKVKGVMNADLRNPALCQEFACEWVNIDEPDRDGATLASVVGNVSASGPYIQAYARGAAIFGANEGCWVAEGVCFFTDKQVTVNPARAGRIWALDLATMTLKAIFVSDDIQVGNSPDNVCISPRGGVLLCEDGGENGPNSGGAVTQQRLMAVHPNGSSYVFARHNYNFTRAELDAAGKFGAPAGDNKNSEWAGAVFSPDGRVLFVNLYTPGITLAITGPWADGTL